MAKKSSKNQPTDLVVTKCTQELSTSLNANSDHVIALLVSEAEAALMCQEREIEARMTGIKNRNKQVLKEIEDFKKQTEKDEQQRLADIVASLAVCGFKVEAVASCCIRRDECFLTSCLSADNHGGIESERKVFLPDNIKALSAEAENLLCELNEKSTALLRLKHDRTNGLPTLERWAKGRVASIMLEQAGGEAADLLAELRRSAPPMLT